MEDVAELRELSRGLASLDQPVGDDGETALGELLASDRPEPTEEVATADRDQRISTVVEQLPRTSATSSGCASDSRAMNRGRCGRPEASSGSQPSGHGSSRSKA